VAAAPETEPGSAGGEGAAFIVGQQASSKAAFASAFSRASTGFCARLVRRDNGVGERPGRGDARLCG